MRLTGRTLRVLTLLLLPLCVSSLGCQKALPLITILVYDNSGSRKFQKEQSDRALLAYIQRWVAEAANQDQLEILAFSAENPYGYQELYSYKLELRTPVYRARRQAEREILKSLSPVLDACSANEQNTPLLEILNHLSDTYGGSPKHRWQLVILSDLMQSSKQMSLTPTYLINHTDTEIVRRMLELCPVPSYPPEKILVLHFPGLLKKDKAIDTSSYQRIRTVFGQFFEEWSEAKGEITFQNLKEEG